MKRGGGEREGMERGKKWKQTRLKGRGEKGGGGEEKRESGKEEEEEN